MAATTWHPDTFPRRPLYAAAALIVFTIVAAFAGRITGIGKVTTTPAAAVETRELRFDDAPDGAVLVRAAADGRLVMTLPPKTNHFVRGTLRGLVRDRRREGLGPEAPFRLSRLADGRIALEDPATARRIDLDAFGRSNAGAFSAILEAATKTQ